MNKAKDQLTIRLMDARASILKSISPAITYMPYIIDRFPKYNSKDQKELIRRAFGLRHIDEQMIKDLETVANNLKKQIA